MAHDPHKLDPRELGHEPDMVDMRRILFWGVIYGLTVVIAFGSMFAFKRVLDRVTGADPVVGIDSQDHTPIPRGVAALDPDQAAELQQLESSQEAWLREYQWTDRAVGVARIPIERAMEIVATTGVPATLPPTPTEMTAPRAP